MTSLMASKTRIPSQTFSKVVHKGERVRICRRGGDVVYLVSEDDLRLLEILEDRLDLDEAREALSRHEASGGKTIPLEEVEARLGL